MAERVIDSLTDRILDLEYETMGNSNSCFLEVDEAMTREVSSRIAEKCKHQEGYRESHALVHKLVGN